MNEKKQYRLLKDINSIDLTAKAGDIGTSNSLVPDAADTKVWFDNNRYFFYLSKIKLNLGIWFEEVLPVSEPVKERIRVDLSNSFNNAADFAWIAHLYATSNIPKDKFPAIKQAIESALNDTVVEDSPDKEYVPTDKEMILIKERRITELEKEVKDLIEHSKYGGLLSTAICFLKSFVFFTDKKILAEETAKDAKKIIEYYETKYDGEQPTNDNAFVWTDELVKEFAIFVNNTRYDTAKYPTVSDPVMNKLDEFKQSKLSTPPLPTKQDKTIDENDKGNYKPVLFTTEDGVGIKVGDEYFLVSIERFEILSGKATTSTTYVPNYYKYFSTKEAADKYVLTFKPCLCLNDIAIGIPKEDFAAITEIAKEKLKK